MKYDIVFPTSLDHINADNDNIDVLVRAENGKQYTFVIATPDNVKYLMQIENVSYFKPGLPFLFVERLTETNIRMLLDSLMNECEQLIRIYGEDI
jgi:hypothetical protein